MKPGPYYEHDGCPHCRFRAKLMSGHDGILDIWTCRDTIMRRYGDRGEEYDSLPMSELDRWAVRDGIWNAAKWSLSLPSPSNRR